MARVLVVGGGIGGLFTARVLALDKHHVTVAERAGEPVTQGAGLVLPAATINVLQRNGVAARPLARPLESLKVVGPDGRSLGGARHRFALARPELVTALLGRLPDAVDVRFGCEVQRLAAHDSGVNVVLASQEASFDFVICADGIRSTSRASLWPHTPLRFSGQVCWRGIVPGTHGNIATEMWDGMQRVGVVPLLRDRSYVYLVRTAQRGMGSELGETGQIGSSRETRAVAALRDLPPGNVLFHELWELQRPVWGSDRIALLGDAAHAITPNLGLGAALAIEDAEAIRTALRRGLDQATRVYRSRRALRVRTIQLASRAIGVVAHSDHPGPRYLRRGLGLRRGTIRP